MRIPHGANTAGSRRAAMCTEVAHLARWLSILSFIHPILAVRAPDLGSVIAADLLARAAHDMDIDGAWRVLRTDSFSPEWLVAAGSTGETPLQAAMRACNAELVALIMLHPAFDDSALKKPRDRRHMATYAFETADCESQDVEWTIFVMQSTHESKQQQAELAQDLGMALFDEAWYLPRPGDWFAPVSIEDLGGDALAKPQMAPGALAVFIASEVYSQLLHNVSSGAGPLTGSALQIQMVEKLWHLCTRHVQSAPGSEDEKRTERQMRSIGWSLFFRGSKAALLLHYLVLEYLTAHIEEEDLPSGESGEHDHIDGSVLDEYQSMAVAVDFAWDRLGNWVA
mmetsp:Transcript_98197/g.274921  ORF Transcript_98197/g.274921 Transcript_98197/m.274921 type:complete len:340 (+) Transcript_98197:42-1061(+)